MYPWEIDRVKDHAVMHAIPINKTMSTSLPRSKIATNERSAHPSIKAKPEIIVDVRQTHGTYFSSMTKNANKGRSKVPAKVSLTK
jgi:hypothetical protein